MKVSASKRAGALSALTLILPTAIALIIGLSVFVHFPAPRHAAASQTYLLALNDAPLYRLSGESYAEPSNILFSIKATYFLKALGAEDENGLIPAEYDGIAGYFPAASAEIQTRTPKYLYAAAELTTNAVSQISLYAAPDPESDELLLLPKRTALKYYGEVTGNEAMPTLGSTWLYAEYEQEGGRVLGYVYAPLTAYTPIPENIIEYLPETNPSNHGNSEPVNGWVQFALIALFCIPALVIVYVIFRVPKSRRSRYYRDYGDYPERDPERGRTPKYLD